MRYTWKHALRATALGTLAALGGVTLLVGVSEAASASPGGSATLCGDDKLYGIVAYPQEESASGRIVAPAQVLEYSYGDDGKTVKSYRELSFEVHGASAVGTVPTSDALGVATDCTFYFVQSADLASETPAVDLYRFNPSESDTPQLVERDFVLNSQGPASVNAGAVAPDGSFYFAYTSRQTPSDDSDAIAESLRIHLYRYVYAAGRDAESRDQPNSMTGEVAHIDVEVGAAQFAMASTKRLHGDLAFDRAGNLVYFVSNERSPERLSAVIPAQQFADLPGVWKQETSDKPSAVPAIPAKPAGFEEADSSSLYMGVAVTPLGDLALLSFANNPTEARYDAGFSVISPDSLKPVPGSTSQVSIPPKTQPGYVPFGGGSYPLDLASGQFAGTLGSGLRVDELLSPGERFTLAVTDAAGNTLASAEGSTSASTTPVITRAGNYSVSLTGTANMDRYTTTWECLDSSQKTLSSGAGISAAVAVGTNQAVSCNFDTVLNKLEAATPTIEGKPQIGSMLTAVPGDWKPGDVEFSFQWLRNGEPIPGATGPEYLVAQEDIDAKISVRVSGSRENYVPAVRESSEVIGTGASEPGTDGPGTDLPDTNESERPDSGLDEAVKPRPQNSGVIETHDSNTALAKSGSQAVGPWLGLAAVGLGGLALIATRIRRARR